MYHCWISETHNQRLAGETASSCGASTMTKNPDSDPCAHSLIDLWQLSDYYDDSLYKGQQLIVMEAIR